jgi:hypothetical protein
MKNHLRNGCDFILLKIKNQVEIFVFIWVSNFKIKFYYLGLRIRIFNFMVKFLTCVLYVVRVNLDDSLSHTR